MGKLSREDAICLHRKMWNWIADENEKGNDVEKTDFIFLEADEFVDDYWGNIEIDCYCFCCEYAKQKADENGEEYDYRCKYCPLEWENANKDLLFMCCDNEEEDDYGGLYNRWRRKNISLKEKAKIARRIANLPERKDSENEKQV